MLKVGDLFTRTAIGLKNPMRSVSGEFICQLQPKLFFSRNQGQMDLYMDRGIVIMAGNTQVLQFTWIKKYAKT